MDYHRHYKAVISRIFKRTMPGNPTNLEELHEMLQEYRSTRHFYKGMSRATDGSVCLIFIHNNMMRPLSQCSQLFCDSTFDVCMQTEFHFLLWIFKDV